MKKEIFKLKEYEYMGYELATYVHDNPFGFKCELCHARDMRRGCKFSFCPAGHWNYLVKKNKSQILYLSLKKEWYNLIESGVKNEEYREIKPYWVQRFTRFKDGTLTGRLYAKFLSSSPKVLKYDIKQGLASFARYTHVCFCYGYTQRKMTFEIKEIIIGTGKAEWGAEPEKEYFVIKLGERVK